MKSPTRPNCAEQSGGKFALAGFLYQLLCTAGLSARPSHVKLNSDTHNEVTALLELISGSRIFPEMFGQDAFVVLSGDKASKLIGDRILIQFKYSSTPEKYPIGKTEFDDIVQCFRKSLPDRKAWTIAHTHFVLVTNRRVATQLKGRKTRPKSTAKSVTGRRTPSESIAQKTILITGTGYDWKSRLRMFASQHGVLDSEFESAIQSIIGDLTFMNAGGWAWIDTKWLLKHLTGSPDARDIRPQYIADIMRRDLDLIKGVHSFPVQIVRRELLVQILAATHSYPIVILEGDGGCGKTILMYESLVAAFAERTLETYRFMKCATDLSDQPIQDQIGRWRFPPDYPLREDLTSSLARLQSALDNPLSPVLIVGIDGVDEAIVRSDAMASRVGSVLRAVWEEYQYRHDSAIPRWSVIVSCRRQSEIAHCWSSHRSLQIKDTLKLILVSNFSNDELIIAVQLLRDPEVQKTLLIALQRKRPAQTSMISRSALSTVADEVLDALHHPMLWDCFTRLDVETQKLVLASERASFVALTESYIQRFEQKFKTRHSSTLRLDLRSLLSRVAKSASHAGRSYVRVDDWIRPATSSGDWTEQEAGWVWSEALSFGMTQQDSQTTWMWKYPLIVDSLTSPFASAQE